MKDYKFYIVSSCLLGIKCRYDGKGSKNYKIIEMLKDKEYISLCPEVLGGLSIPRKPCEIVNYRPYLIGSRAQIKTKEGKDFTNEFLKGVDFAVKSVLAELSLRRFKVNEILAILKEKSPSCGSSFIYDGTFSNKLVEGEGIFAKALVENNIKVVSEEYFK